MAQDAEQRYYKLATSIDKAVYEKAKAPYKIQLREELSQRETTAFAIFDKEMALDQAINKVNLTVAELAKAEYNYRVSSKKMMRMKEKF